MKVTKKEEPKTNSDLKELCVLWEHTSDDNVKYLSGNLSEELKYQKVVAFYNNEKRNEKEPDIRIYSLDENNKRDTNIISLWNQLSKNDLPYYSGVTNEAENVVAFINDGDDEKLPKVRVYLRPSN